jgi:hypothetical protein
MDPLTDGTDEALGRAAARLAQKDEISRRQRDPELDRLIAALGPFPVGHFLVRSAEAAAVAALRRYLHEHWRAWANFIEQMIAAARRDIEWPDVRSDFGED